MDPTTSATFIGATALILIAFAHAISLWIGEKSIFHGSGAPISMANTLLSSLYAMGQILFGIFSIVILVVLLSSKVITTDAGLPIFSAIVGYLLGREHKDTIFKKIQR